MEPFCLLSRLICWSLIGSEWLHAALIVIVVVIVVVVVVVFGSLSQRHIFDNTTLKLRIGWFCSENKLQTMTQQQQQQQQRPRWSKRSSSSHACSSCCYKHVAPAHNRESVERRLASSLHIQPLN